MFASPAFTNNGFVQVIGQNYKAYNRADMFIPVGHASNITAMLAGALVTPGNFAGRKVHSTPVSYAQPTADVRPRNVGIAITPQGSVR